MNERRPDPEREAFVKAAQEFFQSENTASTPLALLRASVRFGVEFARLIDGAKPPEQIRMPIAMLCMTVAQVAYEARLIHGEDTQAVEKFAAKLREVFRDFTNAGISGDYSGKIN